jgi:hypothetical protein
MSIHPWKEQRNRRLLLKALERTKNKVHRLSDVYLDYISMMLGPHERAGRIFIGINIVAKGSLTCFDPRIIFYKVQ